MDKLLDLLIVLLPPFLSSPQPGGMGEVPFSEWPLSSPPLLGPCGAAFINHRHATFLGDILEEYLDTKDFENNLALRRIQFP